MQRLHVLGTKGRHGGRHPIPSLFFFPGADASEPPIACGMRARKKVVANRTWTSMATFFKADRPDPLTRPFNVAALRGTLAGVRDPHRKRGRDWKFYSKTGTLPFLNMGKGTKFYSHMIANMEEAAKRGIDYYDPLDAHPRYPLVPGTESGGLDYVTHGVFLTERDMLTWMIFNNITVCDFGANLRKIVFKGAVMKGTHDPTACRMLAEDAHSSQWSTR